MRPLNIRTKKIPSPAGKKQVLPLRQRLSLRAAVTWCVSIALIMGGLTAGYYALTVIYRNKLIDTWAIMFLELERQGSNLARELQKVSNIDTVLAEDIVFVPLKGGGLKTIQGPINRALTLTDLGFSTNPFTRGAPAIKIATYAGERYLLLQLDERIILRKLKLSLFASHLFSRTLDDAVVYLVSRQADLIYSSKDDIGPLDFVQRPLVQKFIKSPLTHGQLAFQDANGESLYGFYYELPHSNLIMFAEVEQAKALSSINELIWKFLGVLLLIVTGTALLLQYPLGRLVAPIHDLATLAQALGKGDFSTKFKAATVGEISILASAFNSMIDNLLARDRSIKKLMIEQTEKVRLEAELRVAQGIQSNLLPARSVDQQSGVEIATSYLPATECAGDWYGFHYNEAAEETIVMVVDVAGHGAGSSMFTAVIAGLFDRYKSEHDGAWDLDTFASSLNGVICRLGQGKWHATMLMARYKKPYAAIDLLFAGHNPPFLLLGDNPKTSSKRILGPSAPIGIHMQLSTKLITLPFPKGSILTMYTDGFMETSDPSGKFLKNKVIAKTIDESRTQPAKQIINEVIQLWQNHRRGLPAKDDTCVVVVKAL